MNKQIRVNRWNAQQIVNSMMKEVIPLWFPDERAIDWNRLSKFAVIPYPLLDKYKDYWNWSFVCRKTPMTSEFIWTHLEDVDWYVLSEVLPEDKLIEFDDFIVWPVVAKRYKKLSQPFLYEYKDKLTAYIQYIEEHSK